MSPVGVDVDYDIARYLYVPHYVMTYIAAQLARRVYRYQVANVGNPNQIRKAVILTMGGMLPGVLLHDHLAWTITQNIPSITFGTLGLMYSDEEGHLLDQPVITHELSIAVSGEVVGIIEDHLDSETKIRFVTTYLANEHGALGFVVIVPYIKGDISIKDSTVIAYGKVTDDTWLITPRETVETLVKRVPYWRDNGASLEVCKQNLLRIGYPKYMIDVYLRPTYERG